MTPTESYCILVKRGDFQRYDLIHQAFSDKLPVMWERRHGDRRQATQPIGKDRRQHERRGPAPASWAALGFVVAKL
ncbi:MAG TPA: hypothetical protein VNZ26_22540 [Vicinamibacterales bacterium]|jgi:hypothetical protein|nr:hypothetical protein [Vicinamibacterales bacterium]